MATAYQKRRTKDRKHAALMKRDPALREALYGARSPESASATRETAQAKGKGNGERIDDDAG